MVCGNMQTSSALQQPFLCVWWCTQLAHINLQLSLTLSSGCCPCPCLPLPPKKTPTHTHTQGYLAPAMVNYLSLLGWNDGSEKEIYT